MTFRPGLTGAREDVSEVSVLRRPFSRSERFGWVLGSGDGKGEGEVTSEIGTRR